MFGMMTRQSAELENNMNVGVHVRMTSGSLTHRCSIQAVERILYYSSEKLPQERPHVIEKADPVESWPAHGNIMFKNVVMSYRKGLPAVLKEM